MKKYPTLTMIVLFVFSIMYHAYMVDAGYGQESINIGFNLICITGAGLLFAVWCTIKAYKEKQKHETK